MKVCLLVSSAVLSLAAIGSDAHGILQGLLAENVGSSVLSNDVDKAFLDLEIGYMRGIDAADIHHMVSESTTKPVFVRLYTLGGDSQVQRSRTTLSRCVAQMVVLNA